MGIWDVCMLRLPGKISLGFAEIENCFSPLSENMSGYIMQDTHFIVLFMVQSVPNFRHVTEKKIVTMILSTDI